MPTVTDSIVYGRVPKPVIVNKYIPSSLNSAWDDLGQRTNKGQVLHSMVGNLRSTYLWFQNFTGHVAQGLTDFGVGGTSDGDLDGVIWQFNDYLGRRSGWASGGSDGLEGDGPAFVRKFGINAINRDLVSVERSDGGDLNQPMSSKQFESVCHLLAYLADQAHINWDSYPINQNYGIVTFFGHYEFATKDCPFDWVQAHFGVIIAQVRAIMKQYQLVLSTQSPDPVPPVKPQPDTGWPNAWLAADLDARFGQVPELDIRNGVDKLVIKMRGFSEKGTISNMWAARAAAEGITDINKIPTIDHIIRTKSKDGIESTTLSVPRSGHIDWLGFKGDGNATWTWNDRGAKNLP